MRRMVFIICMLSLIHPFQSCTKKNTGPPDFEYEKAAGIWVPYQFVYTDGRVTNGPFTLSSFFGVYAESFQINADRSFFPVQWTSSALYTIKYNEKGTILYTSSTRELVFNTIFSTPDVYELVKFQRDELWLSSGGILEKFSRQ